MTGADAFEKGHWLQGNLFHLGPSIRVMSSISSAGTDKVDEVADEALISYLNACLHLTGAYHLPYIFHGKATVLWTKYGKSNLVAIGMPVGLHEQLQGLVHKDFMRALYRRVLLPVREDACTYAGEGPKAVKRLTTIATPAIPCCSDQHGMPLAGSTEGAPRPTKTRVHV